MTNRDFKGVWIPKEIWLNKDLSWSEKTLLVEIDSLDGDKGCFASNAYLAEFLGISAGRISKLVSKLKEKGYISVELIYKKGTKEIDKRIIRVQKAMVFSDNTSKSNRLEGIRENDHTPLVANDQDNNTVINNTSYIPYIDNVFLNIQKYYEQKLIFQEASFKENQIIGDLLDDGFNDALIIAAMDVAVKRNKPNINYVRGILSQWRRDGIKNIDQVEASEVKHFANTKRSNASHTNKTPEQIEILSRAANFSSDI